MGQSIAQANFAIVRDMHLTNGDYVDVLIDTAEEIQGLRYVRIEHVIEYKQIANRPKDIEHLEAIRRYLQD